MSKTNNKAAQNLMYFRVVTIVVVFFALPIEILCAANANVYKSIVNEPIGIAYPVIYDALSNNGFYVAYSINVGENVKRFETRWGGENKYEVTAVRSLIVCDLKFSYELRNVDPEMLVLCPMHLTLYEIQGKTHIVLLLPSVMAGNSPAKKLALKVEKKLVDIIETEVLK